MLIAIDGRPFQGNFTGVGRYVFEICNILEQELTDVQFNVYSNRNLSIEPFSDRWHFRLESNNLLSRVPPPVWLKFFSARMVNKDGAACFWGSASFLPKGLNKKINKVLTVYDLNHLIAPETMSLTYSLFFKMFFGMDLCHSDIITSISNGTSERLIEFFGRGADVIAPPSANPKIFYLPDEADQQRVKEKYHLDAPYFLSVATLEPRKNLDKLIDAFDQLLHKNPSINCNLVLVGSDGWKNKRLLERISAHPFIRQLGYVPDEDLPSLYAKTLSLVFPSRYEGFGMPVLEAGLCGAVTIATDIKEIREAGNDDTIYVEPTTPSIAVAMQDVWNTRPTIVSPNFLSWQESGKRIVDAISNLIRK